MAKEENEKIKEASEVLERMSMSYEERQLYDQRMLRKMDEMSLKEHAKQERIRRTEEKTDQKNGIAKGEKKAKLEDAKKMLEEGINIETIIKVTGLTKEEILK